MYLLLLTLMCITFKSSYGICAESYMIFCDCVTDLNNYTTKNWTEVVIGSPEDIHNCYSYTINNNNFRNLNEIKLLFVVNQINNIEPNTFGKVGNSLKFLKFYHNNLTTIKTDTFSGFRKLSQLSLVHNNIEILEEYAFRDSEITNLDLSNNKIQALALHTFDEAKIKIISIRNNELSYVNSEAFNGKLEVLHLDYNRINNFENNFSGLWKVKELTISHNKLVHISDISSIENVEKLDLSFNDINYIDKKEFEELKMLELLDLSNNKLETFSLKALKKAKRKMTLLLSYNLITNLEIDNPKPMILTLFGNPWNCECLEKMERSMASFSVSRTKCDLELFRAGNMPICLNQGECKVLPVENRSDLKRFVKAVEMKKQNLSCDLFHDFDV